jgi:Tol biopolymer transport system component
MAAHRPGRTTIVAALATIATLALVAPALATAPGRNGRIVFSVDTAAGLQLFTVGADGHDLRQITQVPGDAVHPDWSPDGRRIVFELDHPEDCAIAFVDGDGGHPVQLPVEPMTCDGQPSFTPDGKRIVFGRFDGVEEAIWSMDLAGGHRRRVVSGPAGATDPNVSPDGERVSFVGFDGAEFGQALEVADLDDGGELAQLAPFTADVAIKHDWAPNGRRIAYTDNADFPHPGDSANIWTVRPDGTRARRLTDFAGGEVNAFTGSYSPDGRWIVLRLEDHGRFGLYRMRPDGERLRAILPLSDLRPRFIDWGPRASERGDDRDDRDDDD